jgi:hypothetical protein
MGEPYSDRVGDSFIFGGNDGRIAGEAKIGGRRLTTERERLGGGVRRYAPVGSGCVLN